MKHMVFESSKSKSSVLVVHCVEEFTPLLVLTESTNTHFITFPYIFENNPCYNVQSCATMAN
jgi:hypothetical protein